MGDLTDQKFRLCSEINGNQNGEDYRISPKASGQGGFGFIRKTNSVVGGAVGVSNRVHVWIDRLSL